MHNRLVAKFVWFLGASMSCTLQVPDANFFLDNIAFGCMYLVWPVVVGVVLFMTTVNMNFAPKANEEKWVPYRLHCHHCSQTGFPSSVGAGQWAHSGLWLHCMDFWCSHRHTFVV